jgi:hypothetical protein
MDKMDSEAFEKAMRERLKDMTPTLAAWIGWQAAIAHKQDE